MNLFIRLKAKLRICRSCHLSAFAIVSHVAIFTKPSINIVKVCAGLRAAARNAALFAIAGEFFSNFQTAISLLHDLKGLNIIGTSEMI